MLLLEIFGLFKKVRCLYEKRKRKKRHCTKLYNFFPDYSIVRTASFCYIIWEMLPKGENEEKIRCFSA